MSPVTRPRVLIASDYPPAAEEYARLLEPEFEVLDSIADMQALLVAVLDLKPDVLVFDVGMPWMNASEVGKRIRKLARTVRVVYLVSDTDKGLLAEVLRGGAWGYLPRTSAASELVSAVREVLRGKKFISPLIKKHVEGLSFDDSESHMSKEGLTDRQREVLKLLAEGRTMKEIAYILMLTPRTIAFHKYKMMERLHLRTSAELVQYAIQEHVITPHS
jgi:DNA-binding NarL/FixJ family response regulator